MAVVQDLWMEHHGTKTEDEGEMELSEAFALGLLADLEVDVPRMQAELLQAKVRATAVDAELSSLLQRVNHSKAAQLAAEAGAAKAATVLTEHNMRIATLHQEIGGLRKRSEDFKTEMERVGPGAIQRRLRRDRAKLSIQIEDRESEVLRLRGEVQDVREQLAELERTAVAERDRGRAIVLELDDIQSQLPSPDLYGGLFDRLAARAHCRLFIDRDEGPWRDDILQGIDLMLELHRELRAGKYRLDKNSDIIGGRAMASAEALYAAVALGDLPLANRLFEVVTDPALFFHQIFNVFRVWCLGLYLTGEIQQLRELLRIHQFAPGLRGGYAQAFIGLVTADAGRVGIGLTAIVKHEWEMWQDPNLVRGAGVVNLGAVGICRLARERGLQVSVKSATVPAGLVAPPRTTAVRS
ncbi:MAG: hypothetical protein A2289_06345 [Deltaproteobacteria bacterium RIFOXYA12_FULL_58_15]|nr:MAG: hypothetical protein A2289_06345 [Deltaproteobacteria bacterium RIFOXYA12_FULL_58_15]